MQELQRAAGEARTPLSFSPRASSRAREPACSHRLAPADDSAFADDGESRGSGSGGAPSSRVAELLHPPSVRALVNLVSDQAIKARALGSATHGAAAAPSAARRRSSSGWGGAQRVSGAGDGAADSVLGGLPVPDLLPPPSSFHRVYHVSRASRSARERAACRRARFATPTLDSLSSAMRGSCGEGRPSRLLVSHSSADQTNADFRRLVHRVMVADGRVRQGHPQAGRAPAARAHHHRDGAWWRDGKTKSWGTVQRAGGDGALGGAERGYGAPPTRSSPGHPLLAGPTWPAQGENRCPCPPGPIIPLKQRSDVPPHPSPETSAAAPARLSHPTDPAQTLIMRVFPVATMRRWPSSTSCRSPRGTWPNSATSSPSRCAAHVTQPRRTNERRKPPCRSRDASCLPPPRQDGLACGPCRRQPLGAPPDKRDGSPWVVRAPSCKLRRVLTLTRTLPQN